VLFVIDLIGQLLGSLLSLPVAGLSRMSETIWSLGICIGFSGPSITGVLHD
jgi:hypothetical protein